MIRPWYQVKTFSLDFNYSLSYQGNNIKNTYFYIIVKFSNKIFHKLRNYTKYSWWEKQCLPKLFLMRQKKVCLKPLRQVLRHVPAVTHLIWLSLHPCEHFILKLLKNDISQQLIDIFLGFPYWGHWGRGGVSTPLAKNLLFSPTWKTSTPKTTPHQIFNTPP